MQLTTYSVVYILFRRVHFIPKHEAHEACFLYESTIVLILTVCFYLLYGT